jgi:hypothetical protein
MLYVVAAACSGAVGGVFVWLRKLDWIAESSVIVMLCYLAHRLGLEAESIPLPDGRHCFYIRTKR